MNGQILITGWCVIRENRIYVDGEQIFKEMVPSGFTDFSKAAFKLLNQAYMKFYKMDNLSKLGFLCAEHLLKNHPVSEKYSSEEIGIILSNAASSIDTDIEHQKTISDANNFFPSPSVFVYTLPNIVIGEICIKHKFQGENTFFIFEKFQPEFITNYVSGLFCSNRIKACLAGWVDLSPGTTSYDAVFYLVEQDNKTGKMIFNEENLKYLYNQ
jgi:hypothetical protein